MNDAMVHFHVHSGVPSLALFEGLGKQKNRPTVTICSICSGANTQENLKLHRTTGILGLSGSPNDTKV